MILAGDIGGTNTRVALFQEEAGRLHLEREQVYPSREHKTLYEIALLFISQQAVKPTTACFGIAGPVLHGRVAASNLPWVIDSLELSRELGIESVWLINDLEAHASGVDDLAPSDFLTLRAAGPATGNAALIAAGTGLGEAGLYWDGRRRHPFPCEGGHTDFAPRNALEIELLRYLLKKFERVSYERVVSGPGLTNIYDFLRDSGHEPEPGWLQDELRQAADAAVVISRHAMEGKAPICEQALDIFVRVYGAEAGNLALKVMSTGGLFISGGIAGKILPRLQGPDFLEAFLAKGRMRPLLESMPVRVIMNEKVGLIGAARYASLREKQASETPAASRPILISQS